MERTTPLPDLTPAEIRIRMARCEQSAAACIAASSDESLSPKEREGALQGEMDALVAIELYREDLERIEKQEAA